MNIPNAQAALDAVIEQSQRAIEQAQRAKAELLPDVPTVVTVRAGQDLQAIVNTETLPIQVEPLARFVGPLILRTGTRIVFGAGSGIDGSQGPALYAPPGQTDIVTGGGRHTSNHPDSVVQIGENLATQVEVRQAPQRITCTGLDVSGHHGKRGFSIHGADVVIDRCDATEIWSSRNEDSQAIYVGNAPGPIYIRGNKLSAGSEVVLVGGDYPRIPGLNPHTIVIENNSIFRPLTWMTDGVNRRVKNLVELKAGIGVIIRNNICSGNWRDPNGGQDGFGIVLTPALDGKIKTPPLESGIVGDVLIEGNDFLDMGGGFNILGRHYTSFTPNALSQLVVRKNRFRIDRARFGGTGQFAKIGAEPEDLTFDGNTILCDGSSFVYTYRGSVLDPVTKLQRQGAPIGVLTFVNNIAQMGQYSFNIGGPRIEDGGHPNAPLSWMVQQINTVMMAGNTYLTKGSLRPEYGGTYLTQADFDALPQVVAARA